MLEVVNIDTVHSLNFDTTDVCMVQCLSNLKQAGVQMPANMSIFQAGGISSKYRHILADTGRLNLPSWNLHSSLHS